MDDDIGVVLCSFFFQAEDGIRDLVRSRGLGDVYKRQVGKYLAEKGMNEWLPYLKDAYSKFKTESDLSIEAVSYTHLTLPTSDLV
mgnify:CR=1 FL=1